MSYILSMPNFPLSVQAITISKRKIRKQNNHKLLNLKINITSLNKEKECASSGNRILNVHNIMRKYAENNKMLTPASVHSVFLRRLLINHNISFN